MRTDLYTIVNLSQVDVENLTPAQLVILAELQLLNRDTVRRSALRFKRYVARLAISPPRTLPAARALESALRTGLLLNCMHPDISAAIYWSRVHADGGVKLPMTILMENGMPEFLPRGYELPQEKRRARLSRLPNYWLESFLSETDRCSPALQASLIIVALTGCRPVEVQSATIEQDANTITIRLRCAKDQQAGMIGKPRFRELTMRNIGILGEWVLKLRVIIVQLGTVNPLTTIGAKSIENACARISAILNLLDSSKITASCFRNQLSADLKRESVASEFISYVLGHTSPRTATRYGTWNQGCTGRRAYLQTSRILPRLTMLPPRSFDTDKP